ncbi:MAG TPA: protein-L-isoaspartate(D-aspartate) O-methyltransferase [Burkholderiales bacterium]|nr:protein-L-isoaspartate(D-aspartate) O-methyltransferase [Burkholderiales bacterium]
MTGIPAQDLPSERARMVAEVDAMYAQTRRETGLPRMSEPVRNALSRVQRHRLVPESQAGLAYRNHPLPIGGGQTISQPYIVALSTDLLRLKGGETVLDVGTGSGYQAAVLAEIASKVFSIEILPALAEAARKRLEELGYRNIEVKVGDGYQGWAERAPFDGIVVAAAAPEVPRALIEQLKPGGRLVIPVETAPGVQSLNVYTRRADGGYDEARVLPVRFVPLVPGR